VADNQRNAWLCIAESKKPGFLDNKSSVHAPSALLLPSPLLLPPPPCSPLHSPPCPAALTGGPWTSAPARGDSREEWGEDETPSKVSSEDIWLGASWKMELKQVLSKRSSFAALKWTPVHISPSARLLYKPLPATQRRESLKEKKGWSSLYSVCRNKVTSTIVTIKIIHGNQAKQGHN